MPESTIVFLTGLLVVGMAVTLATAIYGWFAVFLLGLFAVGIGMAAIGRAAMLEESALSKNA